MIGTKKVYFFVIPVLTLLVLIGIALHPTAKAEAARNTPYMCERNVQTVNQVTKPEGTYTTVWYSLYGNDSARYQNGDPGSRLASIPGFYTGPGPNTLSCAKTKDDPNPLAWCSSSTINVWWDCDGNINYTNIFYKTMLGGTPSKIYFGSLPQSVSDPENYDTNVPLQTADANDVTRTTAGVSSQKNHPFAMTNDAGNILVNNKEIFCVGLKMIEPSCNWNALSDGLSGGPVAWAGYQNGATVYQYGSPALPVNAIANVTANARAATYTSNSTPPEDLSTNNYINYSPGWFNLQMNAVNTQDPYFDCLFSTGVLWTDGDPPNSCYQSAYLNTKIGAFFTYFVPKAAPSTATATPTVQPPTLLPNEEAASQANFNASVTMSPSGQKFKVQVTREYYIKRGLSTIPVASNVTTSVDSDINYYNDLKTFSTSPIVGDLICEKVTVTPGSAEVDNDGNPTKVIDASNDDESCTRIVAKPYLRVYGNDVQVGAKFADASDSCSSRSLVNDKATALAFVNDMINPLSNNRSNPFTGAGSQFAVSTLGEISNFTSASMHSPRSDTTGSTNTSPATDLTFGNYNPNFSIESYGVPLTGLDTKKVLNYGGLSGMVHCISDFGDKQAPTYSGNQTFGAQTINKGEKKYIVVDGDVSITGNITFAGGDWGSADQIPSYYLVVKGNIYISPFVTQLDGIYIAQPTSYDASGAPTAGGKIYTCYNTTGNQPYALNALLNICSNKLTINGAIIAQQVKFLRTRGTLKDAKLPLEDSGSNNIAEVINFSPETYLADPNSALHRTTVGSSYDYITSLSPIL